MVNLSEGEATHHGNVWSLSARTASRFGCANMEGFARLIISQNGRRVKARKSFSELNQKPTTKDTKESSQMVRDLFVSLVVKLVRLGRNWSAWHDSNVRPSA